VGALKQTTGSFTVSFLALAVLAFCSLCMTISLLVMTRKRRRVEQAIELT